MVDTRRVVEPRLRDSGPSVLANQRVRVDERLNGAVRELMLEDDETGGLGAGEPLSHVAVDRIQRRARRGALHLPVLRILVPHDSGHTEDLARDSTNASVDIAVGRAPVARDLAIGRVVNDLHSPTQLAHHLLIRLCRHERVSVCMHRNVGMESVVRHLEDAGLVPDVDSDHEMRRVDILLLQEVVQPRRSLRRRNRWLVHEP